MKKKESTTQRKRRLKKAQDKYHVNIDHESPQAKRARLDKNKLCQANLRSAEVPAKRTARLLQQRKLKAQYYASESSQKREERLAKIRQYHSQQHATETPQERDDRLKKNRQYYLQQRLTETPEERDDRLEKNRQYSADLRAAENSQERENRLARDRLLYSEQRAAETSQEREARTNIQHEQYLHRRAAETLEERSARLKKIRQQRHERAASLEMFEKDINTFCNRFCEICTKRCYPNQVTTFQLSTTKPAYLPDELQRNSQLIVCHRCKTHVSSRKTTAPSKAYWNKLDPGIIPNEILVLSQTEQRLLSRIIPYVKIIKFDGLFGQWGFKGQAVLFAQDVFEVSEKLPNMLPRSTQEAGIVVITECLENLNITREFSVCREKLFCALRWLFENNPLYKDVIFNYNVILSETDLVRLTLNEIVNVENIEYIENNYPQQVRYTSIYECSKILRASWHQQSAIFESNYAGIQCCAMALASIVRVSIIPPHQWTKLTIDKNLIEGDKLCTLTHNLTQENPNAFPVGDNGFLLVRNFDVIKNGFMMFAKSFSLKYDEDPAFFGCIDDEISQQNNFSTLEEALTELFKHQSSGIFICVGYSYGLMFCDDKFYFTDSHSRGPKGAQASVRGTACVIECDNLQELVRICKRAVRSKNAQFTIDYISVLFQNNLENSMSELSVAGKEEVQNRSEDVLINQIETNAENFRIHTSVMAPIDFFQPDVEDELEINDNLNEIRRKTRDNIVNVEHEKKAEEFPWFFLFPYGINGLKETRDVNITPLDYYQSRILGRDLRFQRNDYLF